MYLHMRKEHLNEKGTEKQQNSMNKCMHFLKVMTSL